MQGVKDRLQNSIIERLILRYAGPFLSNIELKSNISEGTININNIQMKEGCLFFQQVEELLVSLNADVWGTNGLPMIWPHGVEITSALIRSATVKLPTPNPFNGEMWRIYIDGVEAEIRTLTTERKQDLARKARRKALLQAEKRWKNMESGPASPPASPSRDREELHADDVDENGDLSEGGLAKKIDRYFKTHLDISFNNCHVVLRTVEDYELPEAMWDVKLGCMKMDLSVGEIQLPKFHHEAVTRVKPSSHYGRGTPADTKLFEEKIGLVFSALKLDFKRSPSSPPCMVLNFPDTMMKLHVVRKQWPEHNVEHSNGFDRIHVELPDKFHVDMHFDVVAIRGCVIRALHQIFDGVAVNVPNWTDWVHVPCPNGWTREGKPTLPKDDPTALIEEYMTLLGKAKELASAHSGNPCMDILPSLLCIAKRARTDLFGGLPSTSGAIEGDPERMDWFLATQTIEWLAYCQNLGAEGVTAAEMPKNTSPLNTWLVVPWRRYEITMVFGASFTVDITSGEDREKRMNIYFPPNMAVALVRDLPAEWTISAFIPGLQIFSAKSKMLDIGNIMLEACWGRYELLDGKVTEKLPDEDELPSVCRLKNLSINSLSVSIIPEMVSTLLPMLTDLPEVLLAPEIHYFFGEWGYMPRPLGYVVDHLSIRSIAVTVSSEKPGGSKKYADAEFAITVSTVDISSGGEAIYMDKSWQAWWALSIVVGETHLSTHLDSLSDSMFTAQGISIKTARKVSLIPAYASLEQAVSETEIKAAVANDIHLLNANFVVSPDGLICIGKLFCAYKQQCKGKVMPLVKSASKAFRSICKLEPGQVPELPGWLWPITTKVRCDGSDPFVISLKHSLCKVIEIKASFQLDLVLQEQVPAKDSPFLTMHMTNAEASIEVFDEEGSEYWEPVMEPWKFEMGLQLHLPPKPRFKLLLMQSPTSMNNIELDISSSLVGAVRTLTYAYVPLVITLIKNGLPSEAFDKFLGEKKSSSRMAALNLSGSPITAFLVFLPRTPTDVATKMQAIFRARRARRRVKEMRPASALPSGRNTSQYGSLNNLKTAPMEAPASPTASPAMPKPRRTSSNTGLFFKPGDLHPLAMCENQRLQVSLKMLPREFPKQVMSDKKTAGSRMTASARKVMPKALTGSMVRIAKRKNFNLSAACRGLCRRISGKSSAPDSPRRRQSEGQFGTGSDVARLMNICRHRQTAVIPATEGKKVAYLCEVVSPAVNDRLLLVQSPYRIFNYTSFAIDVCFTNGVYALDVDENTVKACSCAADRLGVEQPVDPHPYGLPAADVGAATMKDNAWRLPPNVFASVPPQLRHPKGGLMLRFRSENDKGWDSETYDCDKMESEDEVLYKFASGDTVRVTFKTHTRFESSLMACTGQRVTCSDICIVPCMSVLNMCPVALDVQLEAKHQKQDTVNLKPGATKNFYRHVNVNMKLRFEGGDKWSHTLHNIDASEHKKTDELVTLPAHSGASSTEVNLTHLQEVCIISSPLWLCDKTTLGLRCTDKKGQDYPRAGPYFLPSSKNESLLVLNQGTNPPSQIQLPSHFFRKSVSDVVMAAPPSRSYPLIVSSKHLDRLFKDTQEDLVPPAQLLRVVPGIMIASTLGALNVRFNGGEPMDIPEGAPTPVWPQVSGKIPHTLDDHQVEFRTDEHSEWSKPVKCSHSQTGVYSLALAPVIPGRSSSTLSMGSQQRFSSVLTSLAGTFSSSIAVGTASAQMELPLLKPGTPIRTLSVEISDATDSVLSFHISDKSDEMKNTSKYVELAAVETDSHEFALPSKVGRRPSKPTGNEPLQELPPWSFTCKPGDTVGIGWFLPFQKDKTDKVTLYLKWDQGEGGICGPIHINLHSTIIYVFLRPLSVDSGGKTTVARVRQHKQRRCIEIYDEEYLGNQSGFHAEEICGVCGQPLREIKKESDVFGDVAEAALAPLNLAAQTVGDTATAIIGGLGETSTAMIGSVKSILPGSQSPNTSRAAQPVSAEKINVDVQGSQSAPFQPDSANAPAEEEHKFMKAKSDLSLGQGAVTCKNCGTVLSVPGFDIAGTSTADAFAKEKIQHGKTKQMKYAPINTLASVKKWFGALVADVTLRIPCCGISLITKRARKEVVYLLVEGISISFMAPDGFNTHMMRLHVQGVRCDRFDASSTSHKSPSCLASTVAQMKDKEQPAGEETFAVDVSVVRTFVSAFDIFIKEATTRLHHRWEVDIDTELMNDIFLVADEFTKALGPMAVDPLACLSVVEDVSPAHKFERIKEIGQEPLHFTLQRAGKVIQLENFDASNIDVKIWLKLRLSELEFIPPEVRRYLYYLGRIVMPALSGTKLHIEAKQESMLRGSPQVLGMSMAKMYQRDILRVVRNILGSTSLTHGKTTDHSGYGHYSLFGLLHKDPKASATSASEGVKEGVEEGAEELVDEVKRLEADARDSPTKVTSGLATARTALRNSAAHFEEFIKHRRKTSPTVPFDHPHPACLGEPFLRLPRLVLARGRVTHYDFFKAEVLQSMGMDNLQDCLQIFKIREEGKEDRCHVLVVTISDLKYVEIGAPAPHKGPKTPPPSLSGARPLKREHKILNQWLWEQVKHINMLPPPSDELEVHSENEVVRVPCSLGKIDKSRFNGLCRRLMNSVMGDE